MDQSTCGISLNGKSLVDAKIPRSRQVLTLAAQSKESVTKIEPLYVVDSTVLFMRMSVLLERSACGIAVCGANVIVVSNDTDVKIMLLYLYNSEMGDIIVKPFGSKKMKSPDIDIGKTSNSLNPHVLKYLLVIQAFSGCDATAIFDQGKTSIIKLVENSKKARNFCDISMPSDSTVKEVGDPGIGLLVLMYSGRENDTLSHLRFVNYMRMTATSKKQLQPEFEPSSTGLLPVAACIISIILLFRFGYKKQILFGVCFASFGLFLSYFGQNGTHLLLTFGIIQGFGIGISATLNIAITSQYFIKHRGKANGIIFAGCSLGACVFPPVIEYLLEKYGLKGTFLLLSGISLNTLVSTLLMKDPPTILKRRRQTNTDKKITDFDEVSSVEIIQNKDLEANSFNKGLKQNCLVEEKSSNPPISAKELVLSTLKSGYLYAIVASGQAATVALVYFYTTIPDHALSLGIGIYETAYLLSITSIADLCGRIVIGILIDKNFIQICNSYGLSLILSGTFMLAIGLCLNASFVTLTVLCCCFGISHGSCNIHMPHIRFCLQSREHRIRLHPVWSRHCR
ncbi:Monocarboxylate transporter 12 [Nymphon striatum]|nr:Monocarboxylate transporter 12 [Nymphon striatum]